VNSYETIEAEINGKQILLQPQEGMFHFVYDYQHFLPHKSVTIVGIENPENFRFVKHQQYLFEGLKPLFVSRYPQSNDLVRWLQSIPNLYLHFGDLDFEGINIYLNEFKKHLGERASFFIPSNTFELLPLFGNRKLYDKQLSRAPSAELTGEIPIVKLLESFHRYKKVLEQEIFIKQGDLT